MKVRVYLKSGGSIKGYTKADKEELPQFFNSKEISGVTLGKYLIPTWDILRIKILSE